MNRSLMWSVTASVAVAAALAGCGKKATPAPASRPTAATKQPGTLSTGVAARLPVLGAAPGWGPSTKSWTAAGEQLYDPIDGGAEVFMQYDFRSAAEREYWKGGDQANPIEVIVYEFGSPADAFGAYSTIRAHRGPALAGIGDAAVYAEGALDLWQGRYYAQVVAVEETPELAAAVKALGQSLSKNLGASGARPSDILRFLPTEDRVPGSERYAHHAFTLERIQPGFSAKALGLSTQTEVAVAEYAPPNAADDGRNRVFVIRYPSDDDARKALDAYDADAAATSSRVGQNTVIQRQGAYLVGSWRKSVETAKPVVPAIVERINQGTPASQP